MSNFLSHGKIFQEGGFLVFIFFWLGNAFLLLGWFFGVWVVQVFFPGWVSPVASPLSQPCPVKPGQQ